MSNFLCCVGEFHPRAIQLDETSNQSKLGYDYLQVQVLFKSWALCQAVHVVVAVVSVMFLFFCLVFVWCLHGSCHVFRHREAL